MKIIPVTTCAICFLLTACSSIHRTGSVCVQQINTAGYATSDPVEIKPDVVNYIATRLDSKMREWLNQDTKLEVADKCPADYEISLQLNRIDPSTAGMYISGPLVTTSNAERTFNIEVAGKIIKDSKEMQVFEESNDGKLDEVLDELCEEIANNLS